MARARFPVMRLIVLVIAMLSAVTSAMAAVTITADVNSVVVVRDGVVHKTVTIGYISDVNVRSFALDINVDSGMTVNNIRDFKVGESNSVSRGYGIFPGRFRDYINPSNPDWEDPNYNPVTPWNAPGAEGSGLDTPRMVVEMGALYQDDANRPNLSGTLFTFDVNSEGGVDCNLTISKNALRGGIIDDNGNEITATNLPLVKRVYFTCCCIVPDCVGLTREQCVPLIQAECRIIIRDCNVPGTGQPLRQIIAQNPAPGTVVPPVSVIDINVVSYPIKQTATNSLYINWQARGRPACWAYPRQCRGDTDGKKQLQYWVGTNDFNLYKSCQGKLESVMPPGCICADFDHKKQLVYWVGSNDFAIYKSNQGKLESLVQLCGNIPSACASDPNYHYFCLPSSGATCPPGQYCAPPGICPNTP